MNCHRWLIVSGSLLSTTLTAGCLGFFSPPGGGVAPAPDTTASETAQIRTILGSLTRGQQAYYLENGQFASAIADLDIGVRPGEGGYQVEIADLQPTQVVMTATPETPGNPNFAAGVFAIEGANGTTTVVAQCESEAGIPLPRLEGTEAVCDNAQ
ncbi:type IV pilin-like G/H family protein [Leptolyngbya iicbica]|uniref:General secretion pathway protein GspH n=2 Tax=Cyanophyceae TaxID=3028117 RepID=A0A4Q7EF83_9CYAN|nr:type IV pilin-like G/H family protein [Leptolyngbya sp. LK]RZM81882.1 hypothetical protein DYY88_00985 [Leptolyngbya sp. LK]